MPRITRQSVKNAAEVKENFIETKVEVQKTPKKDRNRKRESSSKSDTDESSPAKSSRSSSTSPLRERFANKLNVTSPRTSVAKARCALASKSDYRLTGREKEFDELTAYLRNLIDTKGSGSLYISGTPGTGKLR